VDLGRRQAALGSEEDDCSNSVSLGTGGMSATMGDEGAVSTNHESIAVLVSLR